MHNHSEKIEPKKLAITIILAILLFVFAYIIRNNKDVIEKNQDTSTTSTSTISQ